MRNNAGRMYQRTALHNGGRKAGAGVQEADYSEESGPGNEDHRDRERVRLPHDGDKPESLNGPVIIVQAGRSKDNA